MRVAASGLVAFSVVSAVAVAIGGCGDKKRDGLPASSDWQAPASSDAATSAAVETAEETLARCAAVAFVDDAARDGNLPEAMLDDLAAAPDARAVVVLRALARAAARLPKADQQAMLMASAALHLAERGDLDGARTPLERATALLERPASDDMRPQLAAASAARAWGRLGDADAIARLGSDPRVAPFLARGLAEGGRDQLADEALARIATIDNVDPFADAEVAVTLLVRGRYDLARARVAATPADWRSIHALLLARAAVERKHPQARALVEDAVHALDADTTVPTAEIDLAEFQLAVGDVDGSAKRRSRLRATLAAEPDPDRARMAYYNLHVLAARAGAADEARALLGDLEARAAAPWMLTLARGHSLAVTGHLKEAIEDVERLPLDVAPPRGVIYLGVLMAYVAGSPDPELERWLTAHICE